MNCTMKVVLDGKSSDEVSVDSGVAQETSLGPLLFLCHIKYNDCVRSQVRLFADDCLLYCTIHSFQDHIALQNDLHGLETWVNNWGIHFNSTKSYILSVHQNSYSVFLLHPQRRRTQAG